MKEFWDERYAAKEYIYGTKPNAFLVAQIEEINPVGKILFPCEGEGRNAVFAALNGWSVEAFDYSESGRDKALQLANEHQVEIDYQLADATLFDFGIEKYDVVAFIFAHFPKDLRIALHHKAIQSLKKGGYIILEAFNPMQINNNSGGPKDVSMLYTEEILLEDFKKLKMLTLTTEQLILDEGAYHQGIADVVRMVARKD
jgi:2-polyprenyl-3-methyl-5-hydroxy-6-metoxy-1,4-benzoquinol methylase